MKPVKIKCEAKGSAFWLALDDRDLALDDDGEVTLNIGAGRYYLAWWMIGKSGDSIKIEVSVAGTPAGKIETKIPAGEDKAAGILRVEVK